MTDTLLAGAGCASGPAPAPSVSSSSSVSLSLSRGFVLRGLIASLILIGIALKAYDLHDLPQVSRQAAYSLLIGTAFGIAMERGRFCFFCIIRDFVEFKNSSGLFSVLVALAVGSLGYLVLFSMSFLPNSALDNLPARAHIGPVSWVLAAAGVSFGIGMSLSGACISGHLYRLGEGYSRAPIALFGSLIGFGLGFRTWERFYINTISKADVLWLPHELGGYARAFLLYGAIFIILALLLLRFVPEQSPSTGGKITLARIYHHLFINRWNGLITGAAVGIIGTFAYLYVGPLGVTSQLSTFTRTQMTHREWMAERLNGLDTFRGCASVVSEVITNNGWLIIGLVLASLAMALYGNKFQLSKLTPLNSITALLGGIAMGWGSMTGLGCTVGTLLSGISAFAVSGWVFGIAVFVGTTVGIKLRLHTLE